jgi:hypothetical protein
MEICGVPDLEKFGRGVCFERSPLTMEIEVVPIYLFNCKQWIRNYFGVYCKLEKFEKCRNCVLWRNPNELTLTTRDGAEDFNTSRSSQVNTHGER